MQRIEYIMGMPILLNIIDAPDIREAADAVFAYFRAVDDRYSTYKPGSEISQINAGRPESQWSAEMREVLALCEQTKQQTNGYFDIARGGQRDPSGLVKGWAIHHAAKLLLERGITDFYIDAGGDIQTHGRNSDRKPWRIGIRNPFNRDEIVKTVAVLDQGVATSGTAVRGQHIYDPFRPDTPLNAIVSLTVIGPNIYEADRFATAAFAMGGKGIDFIDSLQGFEGYLIDRNGIATLTRDFEKFVI